VGWRRFLLSPAKTVTALNAHTRLSLFIAKAKRWQYNKIKPKPAVTRRRAKLWQAVDVLLLCAMKLQRNEAKGQKRTKQPDVRSLQRTAKSMTNF